MVIIFECILSSLILLYWFGSLRPVSSKLFLDKKLEKLTQPAHNLPSNKQQTMRDGRSELKGLERFAFNRWLDLQINNNVAPS